MTTPNISIYRTGQIVSVYIDGQFVDDIFCEDSEKLKEIVALSFLKGYNKATQDTIDELKRMGAREIKTEALNKTEL